MAVGALLRKQRRARAWRSAERVLAASAAPPILICATLVLLLAPCTPARADPCATGPFGTGSWPPGCWRPYGASSPFNRPIPPQAPVLANSDRIVARIRGDMSVNNRPDNIVVNVRGDAGEPTYWSQPTDPRFTLSCGSPGRRCPLDGLSIAIPAGAVPEGGVDAPLGDDRHMTIVDQAGGWEYDLWQVATNAPLPRTGGELSFSWGGRTALDGDGLAFPDSPPGNATASHFGNLAGRARAEELASGEINHALFAVIACDDGTFVYPARGLGMSCSDVGLSDVDAPPMGSHIQLDMTAAEIDALPIAAWKKTLLRAMAEYGMYFGDTGTDGYFAIEREAGNQYQSLGAADPWWSFAEQHGWEPFDPTPNQPASGDEDLVGKLYDNTHDDEPLDWDRDVWSRLRVLDPCVERGDCPPSDPTAPQGHPPVPPFGGGGGDSLTALTDTRGLGGEMPDTEPPDTWIAGGPHGVTRGPAPSFRLRSTEPGSSFECMLHRAGGRRARYAACASPRVFASLTDASYTFEVRARDRAGNVDPTSDVRAFRVDARPLRCAVKAARNGRLADVARRGLRIMVRCDDAARLTLRIDASAGTARRLGLGTRAARVTIGRAATRLRRAGARPVTVRLDRKVRKPFLLLRSAHLTAHLRATDRLGRHGDARRGMALG
jgi:hypothetical protein